MKRKHWLLIGVLLISVLMLSGCGVPMGGVDVTTTGPDGLWQTFVVWPLAKALIWLNQVLKSWNIPYDWGFTIILFTLIIKLVTLPLTVTQIRGMQAQREIQPKVQELQKKFGNDRNRLAQEQMKLYQEAGVNPLSGCLPLVIQMPILFGLYAALVTIGPFLQDAAFFWIPNLAFPTTAIGMSWITTAWQSGMEPVPGFGDYSGYYILIAYLVLPILLMVTQFVMQKWMSPMPTSNDSSSRTTQQVTLLMTFMFGFFTLTVPAGLTLYWVTSNLLQMLQQWGMMRYMPTTKATAATSTSTASASIVDGESTEVVTAPVKSTTSSSAKSNNSTKSSNGKQSATGKRKGGKG